MRKHQNPSSLCERVTLGPCPVRSAAAAILGGALLVVGLACSSEKSGAAADEAAHAATRDDKIARPDEPKAEPDPRAGFELRRSLLKEISRAEVRVGGPLIDFGTGDQHKYTRGGWATGWSASDDKAVSAARLSGGVGQLDAYLNSVPQELILRARSARGTQNLSMSVGAKSLGAVSLSEDWQELRLPFPDVGTGRTKLRLKHDKANAVEVDWLWLSSVEEQAAPPVLSPAGPVKIGGRLRRALLAPGSRSYSYYLHPPAAATLIFDYGSQQALDFVVTVQTIDGAQTELFRATGANQWRTAKIDLGAYAGQAIRIELATEGEQTQGGQAGAWGEPGIFVAPTKNNSQERIARAKKAKNLVLVVLDTTRADQFETFTPGNGIYTPRLDAFAKESASFTRAYNNGNWTKPSVLSIFSSLYPATHTATKPESMVPAGVGLISEHMQKHGIRTQGFTSNPVVSEKFGFERGWDDFGVFYEREARGEAMYQRASKWVKDNGDEPFFLYVQTIDPHTTYAVPKEYWSRYYKKNYKGPIGATFTRDDQSRVNDRKLPVSKDDIAWIQALYHGEVSYQDEHVGGFLDALREQGRLEDTIVVVTNDHGEEIYDHGSFGHGWTLYEEMIRAPLMIHYPELFPVQEFERITEHVDLAPTLLQAMGLPPMQGIEGRSFLPALHSSSEQQPSYAISLSDNGKRSIHIGDWKLEVSEGKGWRYLFEITGKEGESRDRRKDAELAGRLCEIYMAEGMANPSKLRRLTGMGDTSKFEAQDANMDEETRKMMEALGYL